MRGLSVVQRIVIGFGLLGGLLTAIGLLSLSSITQIVAKNDSAYFELLPFVEQSQVVPQELYQLQNDLTGYLFEVPPSESTRNRIIASQQQLVASYDELVAKTPSSFTSRQALSELKTPVNATQGQVENIIATVNNLRVLEAREIQLLNEFTSLWQGMLSDSQRLQVGASSAAARGYRQFDRLAQPVVEFAETLAQASSIEDIDNGGLLRSFESMQAVIDRIESQGASTEQLVQMRAVLGNFLTGDEGFASTQLAVFEKQAQLLTLLGQWEATIAQTETMIASISDSVSDYAATQQMDGQQTAASARAYTLAGIAVAIIAALLIGWRSIMSIRNPLEASLRALQQVSKGDFTVRLAASGRDEFSRIGRYVNELSEELSASITELRKNATALADSASQSKQQAATSQQQAGHQKDQAQSIATAINEMESAVSEVAKSTNETRHEVENAKTLANNGEQAMQSNIATINELDGKVHAANDVISKLAEQTAQITNILDVIGGIAEQTNLLALNAAIEAARAGESGRGFAVVADEVRSLADKTNQSTAEIQSMITSLTAASEQAKSYMDAAAASMVVCVEQSEITSKAMHDIDQAMAVVQDMSTQIATAAEQQTLVASEINRNVVDVADLAEQAYQRAISGSESSQYVSDLAAQQNKLMEKFNC
ncbi:methyl-accepting chemotaxis protein [Salinibius halmophilus]|uniref:methyl-accepting chemotaxis protein n=1 Tax=Salinibius halmophilus TaxID=1853216 RepID=UPI000E6702F7|nr:methyl-accepting chemotaxis protein [Salinibius halmophilus]